MNGIGGTYSHVGIIIKGDMFPENTIIKSTEKEYEDYIIKQDKFYILESLTLKIKFYKKGFLNSTLVFNDLCLKKL